MRKKKIKWEENVTTVSVPISHCRVIKINHWTEWFLLNKKYRSTWSYFVRSKSILFILSFIDHYKRKEENSNITRPSTEEVVCVGICEGSSTNSPVSGLCWLIYCDLWWYNHYELLCPLSPFGDAQSLGSDHLSLLKIHFYNKLNLTKLIIMINFWNLAA